MSNRKESNIITVPNASSDNFIPFSRPVLGREEEEAVLRVIRSGWLTTGNEAHQFEDEFLSYIRKNNPSLYPKDTSCISVSSATAGLHLSLLALGISRGDRVLMSPYTFIASAEVVYYCGAEVQFCDIAQGTYHLDPEKVAKILEEDTDGRIKAIIDVSIGGLSIYAKALRSLCDSKNIYLIEDAAHSFPGKEGGKIIGTWGHLGVYSFYANKTVTTGEGGMVHCYSPELAKKIRQMRIHGIDRDMWDRFQAKKQKWQYDIPQLGYKYNMPDLLAALGREQLKKSELFLSQRTAVAERYRRALEKLDGNMLPPQVKETDIHAYHLFQIQWPEDHPYSREEVIDRLVEAGIGTSVHYIPLHVMSYFKNRYGYEPEDYPQAYKVFLQEISLPLWPNLSESQLDNVIEILGKIFLLQI